MTILFSMLFALTVYRKNPAMIGIGSNVTTAQEYMDSLDQHKNDTSLTWTKISGWGDCVQTQAGSFVSRHNGFISYLPGPNRSSNLQDIQLETEHLIAEYNKVFTGKNQISTYGETCIPYEQRMIKPSLDTFKEELKQTFGEEQPTLSRVLPREKILQILDIQSLWEVVKKASFESKAPEVYWGRYYDMPEYVGALHGNVLLLQKPDFFPRQTAQTIQYARQGEFCSILCYIDGIMITSKNALEFGIPLLQYTSSQSYTPTDEACTNIQNSLKALQNALRGALQNSTTPISQSTSFDIPEAFYIPDNIEILQEYVKFLYTKLSEKINVEKMTVNDKYRGDVASMGQFTVGNFGYIPAWIRNNFTTPADVTTNFQKLLTFVFAPPEQNSHFLDPYHLVWYLKAQKLETKIKEWDIAPNDVSLVVSFGKSLQQFLTDYTPAPENAEEYKKILKQMIPRLEYYLQERTDFKGKPGAFPLLDFKWR